MKDAVKSLLKAAVAAPIGTNRLEGDQGLVASIEESEEGPARSIRILKDEKLVYWSFQLRPGEPKPQFYLQDIPFILGPMCMVAWYEGSGLSVFWTSLPGKGHARFQSELSSMIEGAELPPGLTEVVEKVGRVGKKVTAEIWEELGGLIPPSFVEAMTEKAHSIFGSEIPQEFITQAEFISSFLSEEGWAPAPGQESSGAVFTRIFRKSEKQRELSVRWFLGVSLIMLKETDTSIGQE